MSAAGKPGAGQALPIEEGPPRFLDSNPNMVIWGANERTDKYASLSSMREVVKSYNKKGFSGSAINATYVVKRLTAAFGPIGLGWGINIVSEDYRQGGPIFSEDKKAVLAHAVVHTLRIELWYKHPSFPNEIGKVTQFGQTDFISKDSRGIITDEEAPKKSLTDAMTKAASWLGIAADVHLGLWDDNKYTAANAEFAEQERSAIQRQLLLAKPFGYINSEGNVFHDPDGAAWLEGWNKRIKAWVTAGTPEVSKRAWTANAEAIASTRRAAPETVAAAERLVTTALGLPPPDEPPRQIATDASPSDATEGARAGSETAGPSQQGGDPPPAPDLDFPAEPPETFEILGPDPFDLYHIGKGSKGAAAEKVWLATWNHTIKSTPRLPALEVWFEKNATNLARIRRYHPEIASMALATMDDRRKADAPASKPAAAGK